MTEGDSGRVDFSPSVVVGDVVRGQENDTAGTVVGVTQGLEEVDVFSPTSVSSRPGEFAGSSDSGTGPLDYRLCLSRPRRTLHREGAPGDEGETTGIVTLSPGQTRLGPDPTPVTCLTGVLLIHPESLYPKTPPGSPPSVSSRPSSVRRGKVRRGVLSTVFSRLRNTEGTDTFLEEVGRHKLTLPVSNPGHTDDPTPFPDFLFDSFS